MTFEESGLPGGTSWSVTLNGSQLTSSSRLINFTEANGSLAYVVGAVAGFSASPDHGNVTVVGGPARQDISFSAAPGPGQYIVVFEESGLATGASWSVTLNGSQLTSSSRFINFTERNGSYSFTVEPVTGYTASPSAGSAVVKGAMIPESIAFQRSSGSSGSNGSGSSTILGLPPIEAYALFAGIVAAVIVGIVTAIKVGSQRKAPPGSGLRSSPPPGASGPPPPP